VDPDGVEAALLYAAELLARVAGGKVTGGVARAGSKPTPRQPIELRAARIEKILGTPVTSSDAAGILERLGARVDRSNGRLIVTVPSHRPDLEREIDLVEEVARVRGYDCIAASAPVLTHERPATRASLDAMQAVRASLVALGASEVIPLAFSAPRANERFRGLHARNAQPVVVDNPQGADTSELRKSLVPALLHARATNVRNGVATTDLYSLGRTFSNGSGFSEIDAVAGLFAGPRRASRSSAASSLTFWHVKAVVESVAAARGYRRRLRWSSASDRPELHPRAGAEIRAGDANIGYAGEVHPDELAALDLASPVFVFELDLARMHVPAAGPPRYRAVPRFPSSSRDVSLLMPVDLPADRVVDAVVRVGDPLVEDISAFDEYRGAGVDPGLRAVTFRLRYRSPDRTLTDEEVSATHEKVLSEVLSALPVRRRA
jgi:phenylalanyl-tRNA synthetase beta chain